MSVDRDRVTSIKVVIRHVIVHDDSDPGPGKGDFDVTIGVASGPPDAESFGKRFALRWKRSVSSGYSYDLHAELGPIAVPGKGGWLAIAGAGIEHDPIVDDQVRGGLAALGADRHFGFGGWWRTTNGRHFDLVFAVIPGDASTSACPLWNGDLLDAPGPDAPTEAEYAAVLPTGYDRRESSAGAVSPARAAEPLLDHSHVPALSLLANEGFLPAG